MNPTGYRRGSRVVFEPRSEARRIRASELSRGDISSGKVFTVDLVRGTHVTFSETGPEIWISVDDLFFAPSHTPCPFKAGDRVRYQPSRRSLGYDPLRILEPGSTYTVGSVHRNAYVHLIEFPELGMYWTDFVREQENRTRTAEQKEEESEESAESGTESAESGTDESVPR